MSCEPSLQMLVGTQLNIAIASCTALIILAAPCSGQVKPGSHQPALQEFFCQRRRSVRKITKIFPLQKPYKCICYANAANRYVNPGICYVAYLRTDPSSNFMVRCTKNFRGVFSCH